MKLQIRGNRMLGIKEKWHFQYKIERYWLDLLFETVEILWSTSEKSFYKKVKHQEKIWENAFISEVTLWNHIEKKGEDQGCVELLRAKRVIEGSKIAE